MVKHGEAAEIMSDWLAFLSRMIVFFVASIPSRGYSTSWAWNMSAHDVVYVAIPLVPVGKGVSC